MITVITCRIVVSQVLTKCHLGGIFYFMEFLAGRSGPIIPDPETVATDKHLASTESAMDLFRANAERVMHFKQRVNELGRSGQDTVITLLNVDDPVGGVLADILMPGHDWQSYRDADETPVARGLASKSGISEFLEEAGYQIAANELAGTDDLRVLVLDSGVALVMDVDFTMPEGMVNPNE